MPFINSMRGSYGTTGRIRHSLGRVGATTTGGSISTSGNFRIHTFQTGSQSGSTFSFTPDSAGPVEILLVAGGGGGGGRRAGGGGAGGLIYSSSVSVQPQAYTIQVGSGGAQAGAAGANQHGGRGQNSLGLGLTALGGMGGADADSSNTQIPGAPNLSTSTCLSGSGGGTTGDNNLGSSANGGNIWNYGCAGQGFAGGSAQYSPWGAGGGGGAGGNGANNNGENGGVGGVGLSYSLSGSSVFYAGGGAGGGWDPASIQPAGGNGGGGRGGAGQQVNTSDSWRQGLPGTNGLGGGGGGNGSGNPSVSINNGGSGIVIIRYPLS